MRRRPAQFLAVALALAALPFLALAQAPAEPPKPKLFDFYGLFDANVQYTKASGATNAAQDVKGRAATSFDSSNIGIKGALQVDEYIGATYQCETSAGADGIAGANPAICSRNSRIGLTGNWGTLWWGNWDTPFKAAIYGTKADDPFNKTDVFGYQGIMGSPGFNYRSGSFVGAAAPTTGATAGVADNVKGFDVRAQNSIGYHSPKFYGVSLKLQYSTNRYMSANATQDPYLYGAVLNWDYGPLSILAAYEFHHDSFALVGINGTASVAAPGAFGATTANATGTPGGAVATGSLHTKDTAWRVGAGYQLDWQAGATTLSALYEELTLNQDDAPANAIKEYKRGAWHVALKHRAGDHEIRARYSSAANGSVTMGTASTVAGSTTDYGATMLALGYAYWIAPSLNVYLSYAQITNKDNAQYTFTIGGSPAVAGSTPKGADPMAVALGVRYTF